MARVKEDDVTSLSENASSQDQYPAISQLGCHNSYAAFTTTMTEIFHRLFGCCIRKRAKEHVIVPDEESRLIPATEEPTGFGDPNVKTVDQQKLQDRLGTIVRSKEGKMVNINSQVPFNLHNQPLHYLIDPSSSRSASLSTRSGGPPHHHPRTATAPGLTIQPNSFHSHSDLAQPSPSSRSSSADSPPYAYDISQRRGSLAPSEDSSAIGVRSGPILNARLVHHRGYGSTLSSVRKGRPRVRAGTPEAVRPKGKERAAGDKSRSGSGSSRSPRELPGTDVDHADGHEPVTPTAQMTSGPIASPTSKSMASTEAAIKAAALPINIKDVNAIAFSWGD